MARITERVHVGVAGEFGEKRLLTKLEGVIVGRPYDIVDLNLRVPTVKGASEHTRSFMSFDVVSTRQEDVTDFVAEVRQLIRDDDLVLVSETTASQP